MRLDPKPKQNTMIFPAQNIVAVALADRSGKCLAHGFQLLRKHGAHVRVFPFTSPAVSVRRNQRCDNRQNVSATHSRIWLAQDGWGSMLATLVTFHLGGLSLFMTRKPIPGYEGLYEVSDDGKVFSLPKSVCGKYRPYEIELKATPDRGGYLRLVLCKNKEHKTVGVHALVLLAFVGPKKPGQVARHMDGNSLNNSLGNLQWGTYKENSEDMVRHGTLRLGEERSSKLTDGDVLQMRYYRRACGFPVKELMRRFGVCSSQVCRILSGERWRHLPLNPSEEQAFAE